MIHRQEQRPHAQNEQAVHSTKAKADGHQRIGHAPHAGIAALAHGAPREHSRGVAHTVKRDERELVQHHGDAAGRHEGAPYLAHDDIRHRAAKPPQKLVAHDWQAVAEIFPQQLVVPGKTVLHAEAHQLLLRVHVHKRQNKLRTARTDGAHRGAAHAQRGRAQLAENKDIVEKHVYKKAAPIDAHRHFHLLCAAQAGQIA